MDTAAIIDSAVPGYPGGIGRGHVGGGVAIWVKKGVESSDHRITVSSVYYRPPDQKPVGF